MTFGDRLPTVLARGKSRAEATMLDTFTAFAPGWQKVDRIEKATWTPQGSTPGKVAGRSSDSDTTVRTARVGDTEREVLQGGLHIPLSAPMPKIGWEYECTAIGPASDPALLGRRWRVVAVPMKSHATARRLDVVEVGVPS